jgi:hypothetical protein
MIRAAPTRTSAAVLQNPIGLNPEFPAYFPDSYVEWAAEQKAARPQLEDGAIRSFGKNMWDGDFVFAVSRDFVRRCDTPCLVLPGNDKPHPAAIGQEVADLLPNREMLKDWKGPDHLDAQRRTVLAFLDKHTPSK